MGKASRIKWERRVTWAAANPTPLPDSLAKRLFNFIEHPLFTSSLGIIGGIAGLIHTPFLMITVLCIVLAFHRVGVVRGSSWPVQTVAYALVTIGSFVGALKVVYLVRDAPHFPTGAEIASAVWNGHQQVPTPVAITPQRDIPPNAPHPLDPSAIAKEVAKELSKRDPSEKALTPVQSITNGELRKRVLAFADTLRTFEQTHDEIEANFERENPMPHPNKGDAGSIRLWEWWNHRYAVRQAEYSKQFNERYLADAKIYRTELLRRVNVSVPYEEEETLVAIKGELAGPSPIGHLASDLEWLAKQLPNDTR